MSEKPTSNPVSDDRLRNTRAWAAARVGSLSGAEVIVYAIDELFRLRAADETTAPRDPNWCPICTPKGLGYCQCEISSCE